MEKRELTCIGCPMGCQVTVVTDHGEVLEVTGHTCPRGKTYAEKEVISPTRIVTSTVRVEGGERPLVSVKTGRDIPKGKIFACMEEINRVVAKAPIQAGDVLIQNVAGTGADIVATKTVSERRC